MQYKTAYNRNMTNLGSQTLSKCNTSAPCLTQTLGKQKSSICSQMKSSFNKQKDQGQNLNFLLTLIARVNELERQIEKLESSEAKLSRKNKKIRRRAKDVPRVFKCSIADCGRQYGSITSLKNHRKLKHGLHISRKTVELAEKR